MSDLTDTPDNWRGGRYLLGTLVALAALAYGCTDTSLYSSTRARAEADRVALEGRVCTEDPAEARFPVRLVLLVDQAAGPQYSTGKGGVSFAQKRADVLSRFVRDTLQEPKTRVAVVGYGGRPRKLAPGDGNFTANPGVALGAVNTLVQSQGCTEGEYCRDYREGLRLAETLIEGDMASLPTGLRALTQYVVLMVNAGPQDPPSHPDGCCSIDQNDYKCCQNDGCGRVQTCQVEGDQALVSELRSEVERGGGAGLRFHGIHLAAHQASSEINDKKGKRIDDHVETVMKQMAASGGGVYQRFNTPGGLDKSAFDLLGLRTVLHSKLLMAANHNALPGPNGPRVDSDADGLSDTRESAGETSKHKRDTDGDGITDRIETLVDFDPASPDEPDACKGVDPQADRDADGLTDCDELLLGTEPTLVDTDGDAISDRIEVFNGTDYLNHDADDDADGDGLGNGGELRRRLDPRSTDTQAHLSYGYRYEVENQGFVTDLFASELDKITGVKVTDLSSGTTAGVGTLHYSVDGDKKTLRWRDARDDRFGSAVSVGSGGTFELQSGSYAPVQEDEGRKISVEVRASQLPPSSTNESVRVVSRRRQCLDYTIRNIKLMATEKRADGTPAGHNEIVLYFSQAPEGDLLDQGPFRRARIPVQFNPPDERKPDGAVLEIQNREFVRPQLRVPTSN